MLEKTVQSLWEKAEGNIEVLSEIDRGLGQRGVTTKLVRKSEGDIVMKCDAHCSFSQGWDRAIERAVNDKNIVAPILLPLDKDTWTINGKKQMKQFRFGRDYVMRHHDGDAGETMCLQGSCWALRKENYMAWELGDEDMPSWGAQGVELGIKAFLNGGYCLTISDAYYGHVFKEKEEDFLYDRGLNPGKAATETLKIKYPPEIIYGLIQKFDFPLDWSTAQT